MPIEGEKEVNVLTDEGHRCTTKMQSRSRW